MKKRIANAKIACLDINLQKSRMQLGVQILVDDPEQLENIRKRYVASGGSLSRLKALQGSGDYTGAHPKNTGSWCECRVDDQGYRRFVSQGVR